MKHSFFSCFFARLCWLSMLFFSLNLAAANYPDVPKPFHYVNDYTGTLTQAHWQQLENALLDYSQKTSSQIAVVMISSTEGEEIAHYSHTLFDRWGIGRQKQDNGVLMVIAKADRKIFIATGRGLEGALPDALAATIIRHDITPYFKQNQYAQGIAYGLQAIIQATQGEYAALAESEENDEFPPFLLFIFFGIAIFLIFNPWRGRAVYISPSTIDQLAQASRHIRHSGFGGRSGGNMGGFGGGSTGGGGAGGSW